ncbi:MAG TPA: FAD-dependent oxidoreductase [Solirubrobacteraceae bacterium]|nr:FAD-dependent oxidoreductase [Solirubrobacteraceae bacterium]
MQYRSVQMTYPWPTDPPSPAHRAAYADATARPFWLDALPQRESHAPLSDRTEADLCIVGGGYTGLWAALYAKEQDPARDVVVLEATRCGNGASGRNGGFMMSSLTHGIANGLARFADEMELLERLGFENFDALARDLERLGIDAEYEPNGDLLTALEPHELGELEAEAELARRFGHRADVLDAEQTRAQVSSPLYLGALWTHTGSALVHPGKLADGLRAAAVQAGVRVYEYSPVRELKPTHTGVSVSTEGGVVQARLVLLATSAYPPLLRAIRRYVAPVYDYALMSEPLGPSQRESIGWRGRQGLGDMANQFHYYRLTADDRILWGGYDAVYRYGGPVGPALDEDEATFAMLSQHFFTTFPQLEGIRFSHRWGGAIDTCSRFSVFFGKALGGRVVYALGYTGLGVGATRFGARVGLDLLDGRVAEATELEMVRRRPLPFPPEPLRSGVIQLTRNRLAAADRNGGRRGIWLTALDRMGLGFDS